MNFNFVRDTISPEELQNVSSMSPKFAIGDIVRLKPVEELLKHPMVYKCVSEHGGIRIYVGLTIDGVDKSISFESFSKDLIITEVANYIYSVSSSMPFYTIRNFGWVDEWMLVNLTPTTQDYYKKLKELHVYN